MDDFEALPPQALTMMRLRTLGSASIPGLLVAVGSISAFVAGAPVWGAVLAIVVVAIVAAAWAFSGMVYRSYRWRLTPGTVELRRGVVFQRHEVLPRARVQNVTKHAGPIARALGVASVTVHSAGAATPNVSIPDLTLESGDRVRLSLLPQS